MVCEAFDIETKNLGFLILLERFQSPDLHAEECALFAVFATP